MKLYLLLLGADSPGRNVSSSRLFKLDKLK